jgi:SRSO17 transposase
MAYQMDGAGESRLEGYLDGIGELLGSRQRRESFAMYAMGLLSESERKSMEPIAARATGDPARAFPPSDAGTSEARPLSCAA